MSVPRVFILIEEEVSITGIRSLKIMEVRSLFLGVVCTPPCRRSELRFTLLMTPDPHRSRDLGEYIGIRLRTPGR